MPPNDMRTKLRPVARATDLPSEVLPTPGGPTRHRIGPLELAHQGLHREILEDALLDLLEPVMVLLEDALGFLNVELVLGVLEPRQRQEPVEIVAHDRRLWRHRRHQLELLDLALALLAHLDRHLLLAQLVLELLDLVLELVLFAEFLLDRAHLLVEVGLLLT